MAADLHSTFKSPVTRAFGSWLAQLCLFITEHLSRFSLLLSGCPHDDVGGLAGVPALLQTV